MYATTKYTLIEISPVMAERQRQRVMHAHPVQCEVINTDILTYTDTHAPVTRACFFLAMEVMDNLPHDKVTLQNGKWYETLVQMEESDNQTLKLNEALRPVEDHLVRQTLKYFGCDLPLSVQYKINSALARRVRKLFGKDDQELHSAFIPTGSMQLLNTLRMSFPKHHLIAADFDALPAPNLDPKSPVKALDHPLSPTATSTGTLCAGNAPVVASKTTGATKSLSLCFVCFAHWPIVLNVQERRRTTTHTSSRAASQTSSLRRTLLASRRRTAPRRRASQGRYRSCLCIPGR